MSDNAASPNGAAEVADGQPEKAKVQGGQGGGGVDAPGAAAPGEVAPVEKKPRVRREKMPGVVARDDGEDIFPDLGYKSRTGKRVDRQTAENEAAREMREEMGLEIPEPPEKPKAPEEAKPEEKAPQKFKFAGKEFDSAEAAEQSFKSLQGMFKPLQERVSRAEQLAEKAAESARSWRQRAMELEGTAPPTAQTQTQQQPGPQNAASAQQELEQVLKGIDGDKFESVAREHGWPMAARFLAAQVLATVHDQMLPKIAEQLMAQFQEQYAPVAQTVEFQQQVSQVGELMENVSQLRNADGNPAFPELNDPAEAEEVAELWASSGQAQATPQSLIQAIALYRLYKGARGSGQTNTKPNVEVTPPPTVVKRPESLEQGGSVINPGSTRAGAGSENDRFARMLDDTALVDRNLGFAVRRRPNR